MRGVVSMFLLAGANLVMCSTVEVMAADKSHYTLFNPTPDGSLRDLSTDRPDTTESPFTVDAGRVQVETNLFGYTRSRPDRTGIKTDSYDFVETNVRIGLTNHAEIGLVMQSYGSLRAERRDGMTAFRNSGIGGLEIRGKVNFWGNDSFETSGSALAFLPLVRLPTDDDNGISPKFVEAGFIVPYAIDIPGNFGLGLNAGAIWFKDEDSQDWGVQYLSSAALSYAWSPKLGTYYEISAEFNTGDPRGDTVMLGTGVTYAINSNLQLDAGVNFGVTSAADRVNPFVGVTSRF